MTEAANELYISQPAVSKAVKSLETSLGVKLLIRDKQDKTYGRGKGNRRTGETDDRD